MRTTEEVESVVALAGAGLNQSAIARATGVPRATVRDWLAGRTPRGALSALAPPWEDERFPRSLYSYLLGLYLGDGYIARMARTSCLRVYFDARYPGLIGEAVNAVRSVRPGNRVCVYRQVPTRCVVVEGSSNQWPVLFPQHGPGLKHERRICLSDWQLAITTAYPKRFIRGLLHSDGCRFLNPVVIRGRRYVYTRYYFTNVSEDIKSIFCAHLDLLGIEWRRVGNKNISIARRESVARLDEFVGPKR